MLDIGHRMINDADAQVGKNVVGFAPKEFLNKSSFTIRFIQECDVMNAVAGRLSGP